MTASDEDTASTQTPRESTWLPFLGVSTHSAPTPTQFVSSYLILTVGTMLSIQLLSDQSWTWTLAVTAGVVVIAVLADWKIWRRGQPLARRKDSSRR